MTGKHKTSEDHHAEKRRWLNAHDTEYADVSALLVRKSELQRHFTEEGKQSAPVDFIVVGDSRVVSDALDARELRYAIREQHAGWCLLSLLPAEETHFAAKRSEARMNEC